MTLADYLHNVPKVIARDKDINERIFKKSDVGIIVTDHSATYRCVVIRDRDDPLVMIGAFLGKPHTFGFYPKLNCPVLVHWHNDEEVSDPDRLVERVKGVANRLFSFKETLGSYNRYDVLQLPKSFPVYHPLVIQTDFTKAQHNLGRLKAVATLKESLQELSAKGLTTSFWTEFAYDIVSDRFYLLASSLKPKKGAIAQERELDEQLFKMHFSTHEFKDLDRLIEDERARVLFTPLSEPERAASNPSTVPLLSGKQGTLFRGGQFNQGAFKTIFKGSLRVDTQVHSVAIVTIKSSLNSRHSLKRDEEIQVLKELQGAPGIVQAYSVQIINDNLEAVLPFYQQDFQVACEKSLVSFLERVDICRQAAIGLKAYHQTERVYCDFKPENVLLRWNKTGIEAVLTDFEGGKKIGTSKSIGVSMFYCSPELFKVVRDRGGPVETLFDSWPFAFVAAYALSHIHLACEAGEVASRNPYDPKKVDNWQTLASRNADFFPPGTLRDLLKRGLSVTPRERPTMDEYISGLEVVMDEMKD